MEWIEVIQGEIKNLPESNTKVIVKTKTRYTNGNVLEVLFKYDEKGRPVWGCNNQTVIQYLKEN